MSLITTAPVDEQLINARSQALINLKQLGDLTPDTTFDERTLDLFNLTSDDPYQEFVDRLRGMQGNLVMDDPQIKAAYHALGLEGNSDRSERRNTLLLERVAPETYWTAKDEALLVIDEIRGFRILSEFYGLEVRLEQLIEQTRANAHR